ncbi:unnamed protein product, partial [Mesorhabditis spiculigera]
MVAAGSHFQVPHVSQHPQAAVQQENYAQRHTQMVAAGSQVQVTRVGQNPQMAVEQQNYAQRYTQMAADDASVPHMAPRHTLCVLAASARPLMVLFLPPLPRNLRDSLLAVALSFFLFGYQVQEKSIPFQTTWFLSLTNTSMYSLCLKDGNPLLVFLFVVHALNCHMFYQRGYRMCMQRKPPDRTAAFQPYAQKLDTKPPQKSSIRWDANRPKESILGEILLLVSILLFVQFALTSGGHSGYRKPPMHGDFEAQRHWMEITWNLPVSQWYVQTPDNDLQYWGLDYPPLTAYHSYLMGAIAHRINGSWVSLGHSRGIETPEHRLFMRFTAIVPFVLIYASAVFYLAYTDRSLETKFLTSATLLLYPGLIAMDNAHFQYNSISLGLFLWAYICVAWDRMVFGSIFFVLGVNYKQMELYHSLPIFVYILARSLKKPLVLRATESLLCLLKAAVTVSITFAILWAPFLLQGADHVLLVLRRIFPFYRGMFEDKVANFWCGFSFAIKLNGYFDAETQIRISILFVLIASAPSLVVLFLRPSPKNLRFSLLAVALSFFLFSYQVHEKSILLAAIPALLLLHDLPFQATWLLSLTNTSLYSLCLKDGNPLLVFLFAVYALNCHMFYQRGYGMKMFTERLGAVQGEFLRSLVPMTWLAAASQLGAFLLCLLEAVAVPPAHLPHLFPLLSAFYHCCHFIALLLFLNYFLVYTEWTRRFPPVVVRRKKQE